MPPKEERKGLVSSSSGSEDTSDDETPKWTPRHIQAAFRDFFLPMILTILCELWMCTSMSKHIEYVSEKAKDLPHMQGDRHGYGRWYWNVFWLCIAGRAVTVFLWRTASSKWSDKRFGAAFMLMSVAPWIYYLVGYYLVRESLTGIVYKDNLLSSNEVEGTNAGALAKCVNKFGPLACEHLTRPVFGCMKAYDPLECSGYAWVGVNETKCCVQTTFALSRPHDELRFWVWHPTMSEFFSILKWVGALTMKWLLERNPLMQDSPPAFVQSSLVDILDAVIFAGYLENDAVLLPRYGINAAGKAVPEDNFLFHLLLGMTTVAVSTAVLSPVLYLFLCPASMAKEASRSFAAALQDLTNSVRLLHKKDALRYLDEAWALQLEQYKKDTESAVTQYVLVKDRAVEERSSHSEEEAMSPFHLYHRHVEEGARRGRATHIGQGLYQVEFEDGSVEELEVRHLRPDVEKGESEAGCSGTCGGLPSGVDNFDGRAEVFDAMRSLLLLELPFFCWRLWFEAKGLRGTLINGTIIMVLKNLLWGLHDFLIIISCNNENMKILGHQPLASLNRLIGGSAMQSVGVGPMGFVKVAADVAVTQVKSKLQAKQAALEVQKAWLMIEREMVRDDTGYLPSEDAGVQRFAAALSDIEVELAGISRQLSLVHT